MICGLVGGIKASLGCSQAERRKPCSTLPPPHSWSHSQGPSPHTSPSHPLWWTLQFGRDVVMQQGPRQGAVIQTAEEEWETKKVEGVAGASPPLWFLSSMSDRVASEGRFWPDLHPGGSSGGQETASTRVRGANVQSPG